MLETDYEQKYNEILEWARKNKARLNGVPIEEVLPELAESEDEKIRKWILEKVQGYARSGIPCSDEIKMADKAIDYLEKQKEQKPILSDRDSTDFEIEVHEIIAQARNDSRLNDADVLKQFEEEAAFALMLKANKLIEHKPAEWSEEDKKTIDDAYCWLCEYAGSLIQKNYGKSSMLYGIANKLKSLRPSWKPSEEHLSALLAVLNDPNNIGSQTCQLALTDLYEQLKQL